MGDNLESLWNQFIQLLGKETGEEFKSFTTSKYLINHENYKYQVYEEARENLGSKWWKQEDIGTGKIQKSVVSAIKSTVYYNSKSQTNNLIYWRNKSRFSERPTSKTLESVVFNFYKNKVKDGEAFDQLQDEDLDYQFIAYLFFIKDKNQYLPISQERFDAIFELIGKADFKTSRNLSWSNYSEFCRIIKDVREFLKTKDAAATLLDAHSFLWIMGNRNTGHKGTAGESADPSSNSRGMASNEPTIEKKPPESRATTLSQEEWEAIISNPKLTKESDLKIFQALLSFKDYNASASQIGVLLGHAGNSPQSPVNLEIGRYAKRISDHYPIQFTPRSEEKDKYWDFFFDGQHEGSTFVWQLKPELVEALNSTGMMGGGNYPDELPSESLEGLPEGLKKSVTINVYERNPIARQACLNHWKTICVVCAFDFEKVYGDLGKGFIHVHHLTPLSEIGEEYQVDPIKDLRPVCPNCHAMLHKRKKTLSVEQLVAIMKSLPREI
jgi:5-methylcytosine-specific restriction enzyme A